MEVFMFLLIQRVNFEFKNIIILIKTLWYFYILLHYPLFVYILFTNNKTLIT